MGVFKGAGAGCGRGEGASGRGWMVKRVALESMGGGEGRKASEGWGGPFELNPGEQSRTEREGSGYVWPARELEGYQLG